MDLGLTGLVLGRTQLPNRPLKWTSPAIEPDICTTPAPYFIKAMMTPFQKKTQQVVHQQITTYHIQGSVSSLI